MSSELKKRWEHAGGKFPDHWDIVPLETLLRDSKSIAVGVLYPGADTLNGTPLVKVGDIKNGDISVTPCYCISCEKNKEHTRTQLQGDELLITLVGNPGECVVVKKSMVGWNVARAIAVVRLRDVNFRIYLKAVLESTAGKHLIDAVLNTTVQKTLNLKDIKLLPIPIPPQNLIDDVSVFLNAITERITLLRETNATLESIAQALFKSWFVDFDPVHAKQQGQLPEGMDEATAALFPNSFEASALGNVPKDWEIGTLGDIVFIRNERTKPSDKTALLPYVPTESIGAKSPFLHEFKSGEEANSSLILFYKDDILFGAMRPYFHKVCIAPFDGVTRTTVFPLVPKNSKAKAFVLFQVFQDLTIEYATQHSEGSTIPYAKWNNSLEKMPILLPPELLQISFSDVVSSFIDSANKNIKQAQTLTTLRDTLLPRLISGQLRVSDIEEFL